MKFLGEGSRLRIVVCSLRIVVRGLRTGGAHGLRGCAGIGWGIGSLLGLEHLNLLLERLHLLNELLNYLSVGWGGVLRMAEAYEE